MVPDAQLFAMAYGTVPIAHATGGLRDTIAQFQPDKAGALSLDTNTCAVQQELSYAGVCTIVESEHR